MITFDATSSSGGVTNSTITLSHTVGAGSNRILLVGVKTPHTSGVTGVTYNGVALTKAFSNNGGGATGVNQEIWYLTAPSTGANDIVVSLASSVLAYVGGASFFGAEQSSPIDASAYNTAGSVFSFSNSITTVTDDVLLFDVCLVPNSTLTPQETDASWTNNPAFGLQAQYQVVGAAGAYSNDWTSGSSNTFYGIIIGVKPPQSVFGSFLLNFI